MLELIERGVFMQTKAGTNARALCAAPHALFTNLFVRLSVRTFVCLSVRPSVCLFV